ncbi:RNA polymerase sigma factor [Streptomyces sp. NPDC002076]
MRSWTGSGGGTLVEEPEVSAASLGALYKDRRAEMVGLARRLMAEEGLTESVSSAEDVVQSAFTKALRAPASIREPRAYLYAVIRNDVRGLSRRRCVRTEPVTELTGAGPVIEDIQVADFSELVANRMAVYKALYDLSPQQRTAVWATKALDYTQSETAEVMAKSPGTVATHVVRAVAALRANLVAVLVAAVTMTFIVGGRCLNVVPAAGSQRNRTPETPSDDSWLLWASGLMLLSGLIFWALIAWLKRRRGPEETGTFAPQPLTRQLRTLCSEWWFRMSMRWDPRRRVRTVEEPPHSQWRTRTYLPGAGGPLKTRR